MGGRDGRLRYIQFGSAEGIENGYMCSIHMGKEFVLELVGCLAWGIGWSVWDFRMQWKLR